MPIYFNLSSHELPLAVDSIGNHWNQESISRPDGYPRYHWLQTERGSGEIIIDKEQLRLPEGKGVLIAPFVPHSYHGDRPEWTTCFVTFSGKLAADIGAIVGHERFIPAMESAAFSFRGWIDGTISLHRTQRTDPLQLSVGCYAFLMNINGLRDYREYPARPLYQRYVAPVIKEIETNYHRDITVQSLANTVYISPQYLSRLFRCFLGCSTYRYLTNYRLGKAKELLANRPDLTVDQVGLRVGFHDASHFIATFKNTAGCTPLEFRRLQF